MFKAVLEGMAAGVAQIFDIFRAKGIEPTEVIMTAGYF